jgi:glycerol uptake facilitator-like aquaporin
MPAYLAEAIGTMLLVLLGDGVVANVLLARSKGQNSGWMVIATGWGVAVAIAVYSVGRISGAHINPAVTVGLAAVGSFPWAEVPGYVAAQMAGAFLGAVLVYLVYLPHWRADRGRRAEARRRSRTSPAIRQRAREFCHRGRRHGGAAVRRAGDCRQRADARRSRRRGSVLGLQPRPPAAARGHPGARHRPVARRPDRLRHQPRARPRPAPRACRAPDSRQGAVGLAYAWIPVVRAALGGMIGAGFTRLVGF